MTIARMGAALLIVAVAATACGTSPQTHYFALSPAPLEQAAAAAAPFTVQLDAVRIPPSLDRLQLVRRTGENSLSISDQDHWAAPLDEMIRNVLSRDLSACLPNGMVIPPSLPAPKEARHLVVEITEFAPQANRTVTLEAGWSLLDSASNLVERGTAKLSLPGATASADMQSKAMSTLLAKLAEQMAHRLTGSV